MTWEQQQLVKSEKLSQLYYRISQSLVAALISLYQSYIHNNA